MTQPANVPPNEAARLESLASLHILDTAPEAVFEQITSLAAEICGVPISLVSLVDAQRQWFKSNVGLPGVSETHRDLAFCAHAIQSRELMEVADALEDPRFSSNPLVIDGPRIRFYAGAPLAMPGGECLGTLCVIDHLPRQLSPTQRMTLQSLAQIVTTTLVDRRRRLTVASELEFTEARYRVIVEGQSELISLALENGTLIYVNSAYARFFGFQAPDMIGRDLLDFVAEHDRADVSAHLQRVMQGESASVGINRMISADGRERWMEWTNQYIPQREGQARMLHSVGRDITEQRNAEQALVDNEARNRILYESTPAMLHSIDPEGNVVVVSDTWLQCMGYERSEVIGRHSADFLTSESAARAREVVLPEFFRTGRCHDIAYQMVRKDGSLIDVLLSAILELDAQGRPVRSLAVVEDVTERNATTAKLNDTTHMLQLVLDSLPARISYWDARCLNRFANRGFLEWRTVDQVAITGRHVRDVLGEDAFLDIERPVSDGLRGQHRQIETDTPGPDGVTRSTDMRFIPDQRNGEVHGLFVFALDITAQRQAERDLADREHRFKLLVDAVRDYAIFMLDPEGKVTTWNLGAERSKGYRAEEVIGQSFSIFFTPEDVALGKPTLALAHAGRAGSYESEGWRVRSDGSRFWASAVVTAIRDDEDHLIGYAKVTRDLTEPKRQQALLTRVVELAPCAMIMVNASGKIEMVNAEAESTFGYARDELLGQPLERLIPSRLRDAHPAHRQDFLASASTRLMGAGRELNALHKDGREFPVEIGLSAIDSANGISTLAAVFDISERRSQQAAREQALAEKDILLKEVYHRVKNNLQVVQSLLSLQLHVLPEGMARDVIMDSAQRVRAMALVHEKLYQSGNLAVISLPVYTKDLIEQILEAYAVDRSRIELRADIAKIETGLDSAVPYGLLLTELITNSLKHAFPMKRRGCVRVSLVRQEAGDLLTVSDDGVGFDSESGPHSASASMGLKLADGLARQLGGTLHTRSVGGATSSALLTRL